MIYQIKIKYINICLFVSVIYASGFAFVNQPFIMGSSMMDLGVIRFDRSTLCRNSTLSAAFTGFKKQLSFSSSYVSYYDNSFTTGMSGNSRSLFGVALSKKGKSIKGAFELFNALGIYKEREIYLSGGYRPRPFFAIGLNLKFLRSEISQINSDVKRDGFLGSTVTFDINKINISIDFDNIKLYKSDENVVGYSMLFSMFLGARNNKFGSQGVEIIIPTEELSKTAFLFAEKLKIGKLISFYSAIRTIPLTISFGISFNYRNGEVFGALIHNNILGWSKGIGVEYLISQH